MDLLISNVTLANWSPGRVMTGQTVLVLNGQIAQIIEADEETLAILREQYPHVPHYDGRGQLLLPGNICAHTHFYGAYARGLAIPGEPPKDFAAILRRLWWVLDRALTLEDVKLSAQVCLVDAIKHGTTTLIDHHASPDAVDGSLDQIADAVEEAGVRAVLCYEVSDRRGDHNARQGIAENIRFMRAAGQRKMIAGTFGLHASLSLSDETLRACKKANEPFGNGFHVHVAEHESDQENSLVRSGVRVVQRLNHARILGNHTIAAHAVHVNAWELDLLRQTETWVTHQPRSNMNNAVGVADLEAMLQGGLKLGLGNDGFSNYMFDEWKAAFLLHKVSNRDPRVANGESIVRMAVEHNAALAEMFFPNEQLGSLEIGASADLILLDYQPYTPITAGNLPYHILYGAESSMVTATIVAGKVLMWERQLQTLDEAKIKAAALARAAAVWQKFEQLSKF
jgi:putative selenium metabolism protein SsnA